MSLRARLAWTYGAAVFVVVALLAAVSLTAIDRSLRSSLDARLNTTLSAANAIVDVHDGKFALDREDRQQLVRSLGGVMQIAVLENDGGVYFTSATVVPSEVVGLARAFKQGTFDVGSGETLVRVSVAPIARGGNTYGTVAVWQGSDFIDEYDRFAIIAMLLAALGVGGVVVILSSTLARRALSPLERFTQVATEIEASDLSRRVGSQGADELGRLGSAFNRMLDRLESAFARQRRFTADASHELRAPLAVIRAEADVALAKEHSNDEYRRALRTIVEEVDRIDALVDALLTAARADSSTLHFDPVDLGEVASFATQRFAPAAASRGVQLVTDFGQARSVMVSGDAQALERAVAAVLHNALDFARTSVEVHLWKADGDVRLAVQDDGPGFTAQGLEHATERFWRGDPARRRGGTGLGLSIVHAIVNAHHGSVDLANAPGGGAKVTIRLPFIGASSAADIIEP